MFASKTPRDLSNDPMPYITTKGRRVRYPWLAPKGTIDPRPEFDHKQTNEPNPILGEFRNDVGLNPDVPVTHLALIWVDRNLFAFDAPHGTLAHADHARKVLTRLAALKEPS